MSLKKERNPLESAGASVLTGLNEGAEMTTCGAAVPSSRDDKRLLKELVVVGLGTSSIVATGARDGLPTVGVDSRLLKVSNNDPSLLVVGTGAATVVADEGVSRMVAATGAFVGDVIGL